MRLLMAKPKMLRFKINKSIWRYFPHQLCCVICSGQSELRRNVTLVCLASSSHERHLQAYPFNPLLAAFIPEP